MTPKIVTLIDDMLETMYEANGVGLAAPQVGILKRIVVIDVGEGPIVTSLQTLPSTGSPSTLIVLSAIIASFYIYQNPLIGLKSNEILAFFIAVSAFTACSMPSFMEMSAA